MLPKVKRYFNKESVKGTYTREEVEIDYYDDRIKIIHQYTDKIDYFLDVGCGSGLFLKTVEMKLGVGKIFGVDISDEMIKKSYSRLQKSNDASLLLSDVLKLPFKKRVFDFIYTESLLHHVIGRTKAQSKDLSRMALCQMRDILKTNGFLLLTELFYESYGFSTLTSYILFYFLSFFDKYNLSPPLKKAPMGLIVSFYTREELEKMIKSINGTIIEKQEIKWGRGYKEKATLLKDRGEITYLIQFNHNK